MAKDTYLTFSNTIEMFRINTRNVVYIQASGNYSELFTADGKKHELPMQLGQVEMKLDARLENNPDAHFVRIGKQVIANVDYISYIHVSHKKLVLSDSHTFSFTLSPSVEALKSLKDYLVKETEQC